MKVALPVRITHTKRCPEGFYFVINGSRIRFKSRSLAIAAAESWASMQKVQIISVRDYAKRLKK